MLCSLQRAYLVSPNLSHAIESSLGGKCSGLLLFTDALEELCLSMDDRKSREQEDEHTPGRRCRLILPNVYIHSPSGDVLY